MTTTTFTKQEIVNVLKHLAVGRTADQVATIMGTKPDRIIDVAKSHGYPDVDKLKWAADILEKKLDDGDQLPERPMAAGTIPGPRSESVSSIPAGRGNTLPPLTRPDEVRVLINTAKAHPSKRIQTAGDRLLDQIDKLKDLIAEDERKHAAKRAEQAEKAAAKAEVERLKEQLAAAQAKLRGPAKPKAAAAPAQPTGEATAADIRSWARDTGVECPKSGRIPGDVRDAYLDAHTQEAS